MLAPVPFWYRVMAHLVVVGLLVATGYIGGRQDGARIAAGQAAEAARAAADRARQLATLDTAEAIKAEQARAAARLQSLKDRHALDQDIARVGDRGCGLDPDSFRLLNDRIRAANGSPAAGRGDGPVPRDPGASGRQRADTAPVDG